MPIVQAYFVLRLKANKAIRSTPQIHRKFEPLIQGLKIMDLTFGAFSLRLLVKLFKKPNLQDNDKLGLNTSLKMMMEGMVPQEEHDAYR